MNWITCNLPWYFYFYNNRPKLPNLEKKIKKHFGKTPEEAYKALPAKDQKGFKLASKKFKEFSDQVRQWQREQPEIKAYYEEVNAISVENSNKSFCGRGLNKAGTLIEVSHNNVVKQYLIGDINTLGGVCDDCMAFENDAIVLRYKVVYDPN